MRVWVDADSCPRPVRDIVSRAAAKRGICTIFVANRALPDEPSECVSLVRVAATEGAADEHILTSSERGDLVVTRDIPLAASLVERAVSVLNDRGDLFTFDNVRERLSMRDFMYELRSSGLATDREGRFGRREAKRFADAFDRELTRLLALGRRS